MASPKKPVRVPKLSRHPKTNQAYVTWKKKRHYLGVWGKAETEERYRRFVADLVTSPSITEPAKTLTPAHQTEIVELCAAFLQHAQTWYVKNGKPTAQLGHVKQHIRILRDLFGSTPVADFGPLALQTIQKHLVANSYTRPGLNSRVQGIRRIFKWGVSQELVPPSVYQALSCVSGLRKGRTTAPETQPIMPVDDATVDATLPFLPDIVADMIRFQRLTGARPGEVRIIRSCDVDRSGEVWLYRPESHKTEHHGRERIVYIGPKAQDVIRPYLLRDAGSYCFCPKDSARKQLEKRREERVTPDKYGNRPGTNRKAIPRLKPGDCYAKDAYPRAVARGIKKANEHRKKEAQKAGVAPVLLEPWTPARLRHTAATNVRKAFGLEAAQVTLGHATADITQIYAERDSELATEVAKRIG